MTKSKPILSRRGLLAGLGLALAAPGAAMAQGGGDRPAPGAATARRRTTTAPPAQAFSGNAMDGSSIRGRAPGGRATPPRRRGFTGSPIDGQGI